jgi:lysophospholipase L1-like esterase
MKRAFPILIFLLSLTITCKAQTFIKPNNPAIKFTGSMFNHVTENRVIFYRHSQNFYSIPDNIAQANDVKAKTNTGITINFKTDASQVEIHFKMMEGDNSSWLYSSYYIDGDSIGIDKTKRDDVATYPDSAFSYTISSPGAGTHTYRIVLSTWSTVAFDGLTLTGNSESLEDFQLPEKPLYVAYGNSITHGRGQNIGDQTYPWLVAKNLGWELYNIAVGGSKTSVPMATMIANEMNVPIDYLSILIGYNDAIGAARDTNYYRKVLIAFVDSIRKGHPETTIFVLGQTYTIATENSNGDPVDFDDWRKVQKFVVDSLTADGDTLIHYINGADFTDYNDLKDPPTDMVHLSIAGAYRFGNKLADTIEQILSIPTSLSENKTGKNRLDIYPNPAGNKVIISYNFGKAEHVQLYDINGKKLRVSAKPLDKNSVELNISDLPAGVYIIKLGNSSSRLIKR